MSVADVKAGEPAFVKLADQGIASQPVVDLTEHLAGRGRTPH
jgi:hypothetical protein